MFNIFYGDFLPQRYTFYGDFLPKVNIFCGDFYKNNHLEAFSQLMQGGNELFSLYMMDANGRGHKEGAGCFYDIGLKVWLAARPDPL